LGHLDIILRAADVFDRILVVVAENSRKHCLFSANERADMLKRLVMERGNVRVEVCDSLVVDFLRKENVKLIVRGVREVSDFSYEAELSTVYKALDPGIETIFMTTDPKYFHLRSSFIKEIALFGGNVAGMVPPLVAEALAGKFGA
jgi:pantetheine-phosphate adenylyltransferase